jgi:type IV secretory pathway VirB10-like protein
MNLGRALSVGVLLAILLGVSGCRLTKKKPNIPQQASAPTIRSQPTPNQPGPPPPISSEPARPLPTPGEAVATEEAPKPLPKPKTHVAKKTVPPPPAPVEANKPAPTVTAPPQQALTPSISHDDALHRKLDTAQLIELTESNLRSVNRSLNNNEEATVQHIRSFIKQAQTATTDGDYERAYNLAQKAHLLSDELMKP